MNDIPPPDIDWSVPPDPQEIELLCERAKLPLSEKLRWLDEAQLMVEHLQEQHRRRSQLPVDDAAD